MPVITILQRLKEETRQAHEQAEETLPLFQPGFDLNQYALLLERLYGFWMPLEARLATCQPLLHAGLNLDARYKSHLLAADLLIFGRDTTALPLCANLPDVAELPEALGCLYVIEGSTLGGQVIARHLQKLFGIDATSSASFYHAYGGKVGQYWREFGAFLTEQCTDADSDRVVASAVLTFARFKDWFAERSDNTA